jgi:hypothetical protein
VFCQSLIPLLGMALLPPAGFMGFDTLSPGMAVTVEIKTGSRHIISYLLSPIKKHASQDMRER